MRKKNKGIYLSESSYRYWFARHSEWIKDENKTKKKLELAECHLKNIKEIIDLASSLIDLMIEDIEKENGTVGLWNMEDSPYKDRMIKGHEFLEKMKKRIEERKLYG
ncbi:MAG: hypothetical protein WC476_01465 [Phycisphaerae bacterium]|jgi:hypothetical protein